MGGDLTDVLVLRVGGHDEVESRLNRSAVFRFCCPEVEPELIAELSIGLGKLSKMALKSATGDTHDQCLKVEASVMERTGTHGFERLFSGGSDLIKELVGEEILEDYCSTIVIPCEYFSSDNLGYIESTMVAMYNINTYNKNSGRKEKRTWLAMQHFCQSRCWLTIRHIVPSNYASPDPSHSSIPGSQ